MREIRTKVYYYDELSDKAKAKAYDDWSLDTPYPFEEENGNTLRDFLDMVGIDSRDVVYNYGDLRVPTCKVYMPESYYETGINDIEGKRLIAYIWNNFRNTLYGRKIYQRGYKNWTSKVFIGKKCCPLTGYYFDEAILEPMYNAIEGKYKGTYKELIEECLDKWVKAADADYNGYFDKESFIGESRNNGWEYYEDGTLY